MFVAAFAATAEGRSVATTIVTWRWTSSAASMDNRVIPAFCEPVVDHDILPNDEARALKRLEKWRSEWGF